MANSEEKGMVKGMEIKDQVNELKEEIKKEIKAPKNIGELWIAIDARFKALEERIDAIDGKFKEKIKEGNGRGPLSTREMNEDDARRIMLGDLKDKSHKDCAQELGLSYGQIYSARGGYTFKGIYAEREKALKEKAQKDSKK